MNKGLRAVFALLRSLKLTAALVGLLGAACAVATFVPDYPFFSSPFFLILVGLFFVNLLSCTVFRLVRELRKKTGRNFGPDILHGGLLLFVVAAFFSVANRMEGSAMLTKGQTVLLPNGVLVVLDDLVYLQYENGRPRAWISYLTVLRDGVPLFVSYPLEVNHPLKIGGYSLYQNSYGSVGGETYTVISVVQDPGYLLVWVSFILCGAGTFITLFYKLRRAKP